MKPGVPEMVSLGKVTGTHGIRGQVKVHLYSGNEATLSAAGEVLLRGADGSTKPLSLAGVRQHGRRTLLTLDGYDCIDDVLPLVGGELLVRRDQLPKPDEGEYYWVDLIGLRVVTEEREELGILREIIETGSNDVYVVKGEGKEFLIPATGEVVREIDLEGGTMTVALLEGMLDL